MECCDLDAQAFQLAFHLQASRIVSSHVLRLKHLTTQCVRPTCLCVIYTVGESTADLLDPVLKTQRGQFTGTLELTFSKSEYRMYIFHSVQIERYYLDYLIELRFGETF